MNTSKATSEVGTAGTVMGFVILLGLGALAWWLLAPLFGGGGDPVTTAPPVDTPAVVAVALTEQEQESQFVAMLGSIAPYTAQTPERSVGRGENICLDLANGDTDVVSRTQERFTGGSGSIDAGQARQIVEAAQATIC